MNYTTSETEFAKIAGLSLQTIRNYRLGVTVKGKFYEPMFRPEEWLKIGRGIFYRDDVVIEFTNYKKPKEVKNV
jgi:hypothetical protein